MANINAPFGARFLEDPWGFSSAGKLEPFIVDSTDATPLFVGDFVRLTGGVDQSQLCTDNQNYGYLPIVTQASASSAMFIGVVEGFGVDPNQLTTIYRPAHDQRTVWVRTNPFAFFLIQTNGTALTADMGKMANIVVGSGSTRTGLSSMQLDYATVGTGTQLKMINVDYNSSFGLYAVIKCMINLHYYKLTTFS